MKVSFFTVVGSLFIHLMCFAQGNNLEVYSYEHSVYKNEWKNSLSRLEFEIQEIESEKPQANNLEQIFNKILAYRLSFVPDTDRQMILEVLSESEVHLTSLPKESETSFKIQKNSDGSILIDQEYMPYDGFVMTDPKTGKSKLQIQIQKEFRHTPIYYFILFHEIEHVITQTELKGNGIPLINLVKNSAFRKITEQRSYFAECELLRLIPTRYFDGISDVINNSIGYLQRNEFTYIQDSNQSYNFFKRVLQNTRDPKLTCKDHVKIETEKTRHDFENP